MIFPDEDFIIASSQRVTKKLLIRTFRVSINSILYPSVEAMADILYEAARAVKYKAEHYIAAYKIHITAPEEAKKLLSFKYFYWGTLKCDYTPASTFLQALEIEIDSRNFFMYKPYKLIKQ